VPAVGAPALLSRTVAARDDTDSAGAFDAAVRAVIESIPPGEVLTYGEVAAEAGSAGAARAVGAVLAGSGGALPWWRVVTSTGRLVPGHEADHARRLRREGVDIDPATGRVRLPRR
jgi:alkylated DNA nucleotide flippase Atl1